LFGDDGLRDGVVVVVLKMMMKACEREMRKWFTKF
jgi:hypothetical protein